MYFDSPTLAGLLSTISLFGILYAMASKAISSGRVSLKGTARERAPERRARNERQTTQLPDQY